MSVLWELLQSLSLSMIWMWLTRCVWKHNSRLYVHHVCTYLKPPHKTLYHILKVHYAEMIGMHADWACVLKVFKQLMFTANTYIVTDWKTQEEAKENMVLKCHAAPKAEDVRPRVCNFNEGKKKLLYRLQTISQSLSWECMTSWSQG